jgi:hypothetical protein
MWMEATKLKFPIMSVTNFGSALAIEGELIAVAANVNGDEETNSASAGIAYVFVKGCTTVNGTNWVLRNQLLANTDNRADESFGSAVQLLDGVVVVGASNPGAVLFFNIPIALGPTCAPYAAPSLTPRTSPAPTHWWVNLDTPSLRPTLHPATGISSKIGSKAPAPTSNPNISCEACHAFGVLPGYRVYQKFWFGSVCADMCVRPSFLDGAELYGWSCSGCD